MLNCSFSGEEIVEEISRLLILRCVGTESSVWRNLKKTSNTTIRKTGLFQAHILTKSSTEQRISIFILNSYGPIFMFSSGILVLNNKAKLIKPRAVIGEFEAKININKKTKARTKTL